VIYLLSNQNDSTSDLISEYLKYFGSDFYRIDYQDSIHTFTIRLSDNAQEFGFQHLGCEYVMD
jgi:hypothetical protein